MSLNESVFNELLRRVRAGYEEDPGLRLNGKQAARLFSLEERTCRNVLTVLVATGFLKEFGRDLFIRLSAF
jgi:hypothetical protein